MANTKDERLPHLTVACCTPLYGISIYICSGTLLSRAGFMTFSNPALIVLMMGSGGPGEHQDELSASCQETMWVRVIKNCPEKRTG